MLRQTSPLALLALLASATTATALVPRDLPPFEKVSEGFRKVVSTADGAASLYGVWVNDTTNQMLAELPRGWAKHRYFFAVTPAGGEVFTGLQGPAKYVYWRRQDDRLLLIEPHLDTRSLGDRSSKDSVTRIFTDRVLLDVPVIATGPGGQPVIDLDDLLVGHASTFAGGAARGVNKQLARVVKAKAFPGNVEIAIEMPVSGGRLKTFHYSISLIPDSTGYTPRVADERVGYFTTAFRDLSKYRHEEKWIRYIDRWHLEKRDPKLKLSPPKEPIVFYLEHTVPVRYRRFVRDGLLYWNDAFSAIGLDNAIEVRYQDATTGAHMEKDPEDVRYNFIRWLHNDVSTAIGPHRAHPLTGQILDADIVLTDGWIRAFWSWYYEEQPQAVAQGFTRQTLEWLEDIPSWDPRVRLLPPEQRMRALAGRRASPDTAVDPLLAESGEHMQISAWLDEVDTYCLAARGLAFDMAFGRLILETYGSLVVEEDEDAEEEELLDGIPESFVGQMLADLVAHEVGHTLGLRHNFKASSLYGHAEINSEAVKGVKPLAASVMDYLPANFNFEGGTVQGDYTMIGIGPYDHWAIEYGYTFGDRKEVLKTVAEPGHAYLTDEDTSGPDPLARRYDFSADPMTYAENQMRIVRHQRAHLIEEFVDDGESWAKTRRGYGITLSMQQRMIGMMSNWIGGAHVHRDRKGDPDGHVPIEVVDVDRQRRALAFVVANAFEDDAYGLTTDLLLRMTVDKWSDGGGDRGESTWPVHDRVLGTQAAALTYLLNPSTLGRVYDNEFRVPADQDAMTLPELFRTIVEGVYGEITPELPSRAFSDRRPMISSLRRNLQSELTGRLIDLATGRVSISRPVQTLALHHIRHLKERAASTLKRARAAGVDDYSVAHLEAMEDRIGKALDSVYVVAN